MKKMLLVMNPYAGMRRGSRHLSDIIALFNRADYQVSAYMTAGIGDAAKVIARQAADSDVVIATVCEEWGMVMAIFLLLAVVGLALFVIRSAAVGRSSFYTISGCTAAGIMLVQVILNVLGTVDVLPLTGVTFPFLSNGGSSMICAWGLLAFIKATDTRQSASFAVRLHKSGGKADE